MLVFLGTQADGGSLLIGQEHVSLLRFPVTALACLAAEHVNAGIGIAGGNIDQAGLGDMCDYRINNLMEMLDIIL